jgi:hypothetical protein
VFGVEIVAGPSIEPHSIKSEAGYKDVRMDSITNNLRGHFKLVDKSTCMKRHN